MPIACLKGAYFGRYQRHKSAQYRYSLRMIVPLAQSTTLSLPIQIPFFKIKHRATIQHYNMADVLPFKGKTFCGSLEVQGQLTATSKVLRIQRMKEVFEQEKMLSAVAAEAHRQCIAERKAARMRMEIDRKRKEKENELRILSNKRDTAVSQTGAAHERAKKNVDIMLKRSEMESMNAARRHEEVLQRGKAALKLRHEQILETQRASMRILELHQTKREIRMSDREDAHANGEVYSARQQLLALQKEAVANLHSVPVVYTQTRVQQGAVSIEQRFPVEVHAQVWRHGVNGAANSAAGSNSRLMTEVLNEASIEEMTVRKKTWSKVMTEMLTKIKIKMRAQVAKITVQQRKGVIYLESELQRLEAADKAPARQTRVCSTVGVAPDAEPPRVQSAFEKMFLSKPVRLDNKHIQYRTGSHLVQANLEKHVQHVQHQQDVDSSGGAFPTWHSEQPDHAFSGTSSAAAFPEDPHATFHGAYAEADTHSTGGSSTISEELRVLQSERRMYEDLDGCSTVSDIPMISRPPPHWTSYSHTFETHEQDQHSLGEDAALASAKQQRAQSNMQNVEVKIPRVQKHSGSSGHREQEMTRKGLHSSPSPLPSSPSSVATSPSTASSNSSSFSQAVSMKSSMDSESSSSSWAGSVPPPPPAPLSLRIEVAKGALDLSLNEAEVAVTPPRHQSSRGSAGGGRGHIDPFTPPEVSAPPRSSHHRPQQQQQQAAAAQLLRSTEEAGSPQSGVSSTNTEQARHDRLPRYDPASAVPANRQLSSRVLNDSTQSAESYISPPSAPTRGGVLQRSPLWTEDDDSRSFEEMNNSRNDANVSALTELLFDDGSSTTSTLSELRRAKHALSSSDEVSAGSGSGSGFNSSRGMSVSSKASSHKDRRSRDKSEDVGSTSSLASGSSLRSSTSTASSATSASSASSASSSSASMLSYLDSAQKPARPDAAAPLPGVTITIAGNTGAHVPSAPLTRAFSPSHSLESDSVSMLSITSDHHPHEAMQRHAAEGGSMLDSFAALTHQELQDVLDDLSDEGEDQRDITRSPLQAQDQTSSPYARAYTQAQQQQQHQQVPQPGSVDRSHSTRSGSSREVSPDASDYASMFGSDDDEDHAEEKKDTKGALRSFPLPHTIDRIVEEEEESSQAESMQSASTGELFDRWQQLYQGSLHLGTEARALRSEHVSAYNATSSSIALSEEESFLSHDMTSPPRKASAAAAVSASPLNVLVFPQQQRGRTEERMEFSKSTLYESDLRSSQSSGHRSRSTSPIGSDADSRSSDSLSPRKRNGNKSSTPRAASLPQQSHPVAHSNTITSTFATTTTTRSTSVDVRASYEHNSRATALMSELDKLSLDWQEKQAFYANPSSSKAASAPALAPASAVGATPPRAPSSSRAAVPQPAQPPHYASPSWLTRSGAPEGTASTSGRGPASASNITGAGMASTSLSSLSAVNSPPEKTTTSGTATRDAPAASRDVYTGRLFVHGESRAAYPVTATHLPDLAARLELEDSMNSSLLSSDIGVEDVPSGLSAGARNITYSHSTYSAYSSEGEDEEVENRSLEELLNSQAGSATRGRIQSEIAAMRSRLLASVGGSSQSGATRTAASPPFAAPVAATTLEESIRSSTSVRVDNSALSRTQATAAHAASGSRSLSSHSQRGVVPVDAGAAQWHSSGEDTYSSSRYYSAGSSEARHSSATGTKVSTASGSGSSSMHTADTSSVDAAVPRHHAVDSALLSTTRNVTTTHSAVASSTTQSSHYTSSSTFRFVSHTAGGSSSSPGLRDDSGRPEAYTFRGKHSAAHIHPSAEEEGNPSSPANTSSSSATESFLLAQQQLNSPNTPASVSRLSEYAMLSQHTLHTSRGSPGSDSNSPSPQQWRQPSSRAAGATGTGEGGGRDGSARAEDDSYEFSRHAANNTSSASDNSSTFSEYMRHFPSNR